jgi:uncharacterized protein (UPF0335 family)
MQKKAIIMISLVPEASQASNSQIEEEIKNEAQIPWCQEIEEISIEELRGHGFSKKAERDIVRSYKD